MSSLVKPLTKLLGLVLFVGGIAALVLKGYVWEFRIDAPLAVIFIATGVFSFAASGNYSYARLFLLAAGAFYGIAAILGFLGGNVLGFFGTNDATNILHLGIGLACLGIGFGSKAKS